MLESWTVEESFAARPHHVCTVRYTLVLTPLSGTLVPHVRVADTGRSGIAGMALTAHSREYITAYMIQIYRDIRRQPRSLPVFASTSPHGRATRRAAPPPGAGAGGGAHTAPHTAPAHARHVATRARGPQALERVQRQRHYIRTFMYPAMDRVSCAIADTR